MKYKVTDEKQLTYNGYVVVDLRLVPREALTNIYHLAFLSSDANGDLNQSPEEKEACFDALGLPTVLRHFASHGIMKDDQLVGYVLVEDTENKELNINCMVVHPEHQNKGIGYLMLKIMNNRALDYGYTYLNIDVDQEMKAFNLLERFGFEG